MTSHIEETIKVLVEVLLYESYIIKDVSVFNIFFDHAKIRRRSNLVSCNNESLMVTIDKVNNSI